MQQWIKDAHFEQIKKIVAGILVFIIEHSYVKGSSKWSNDNR
jgi:hypothetical protein